MEVHHEPREHRRRAEGQSDRGRLGVNAPLIAAGSLAVLAAAVHGVGGEVFVVRKLSPDMLPSSRFGGPRMTMTMIHVTWHMTTIAFLTVGSALLLAGSVLHGDAARGIGLLAAGASTGFTAVAAGGGGIPSIPFPAPRSRRAHRHRGAGVVGSALRYVVLLLTSRAARASSPGARPCDANRGDRGPRR